MDASQRLQNLVVIQRNHKKFGGIKENVFLCSVKKKFLATPLSAGSKALSILLHLNKRLHHVWCGFFISHISCGIVLKKLTVVDYDNIYLTLRGATMVIGVEDRYMFVQHVPNIYLSYNSKRIRLLIEVLKYILWYMIGICLRNMYRRLSSITIED